MSLPAASHVRPRQWDAEVYHRVTALILERVPRGRVIGIDASGSMIDKARETLGGEVELHGTAR